MLGDYFKFLKNKKPDVEEAVPPEEKPAITLEQTVPLATPNQPKPVNTSHIIDTQHIPDKKTVVDTLDIATYGERSNTPEMLKRFLGRQPILNAAQQIIGYEFSLRHSMTKPATPTLQQMCDEMLIASLIDFDLQPMLGNKLAFIAIAPTMLSSNWVSMLPSHNMVLAIDCSQISDPDSSLAACRKCMREGFTLALDNPPDIDSLAPIIAIAKYIRLDTDKLSAIELNKRADMFKQTTAILIAKHVHTEDDFVACQVMAFNCFQGYYFTQRQPNAPHRIDNNRARVLELLNLTISHAEIHTLENILKRDAVLSYKLLTFINSPAIGLAHKLESISQALILLGYNQFYRWLTLLLFNSGQMDARAQALLQNALIRAHMMETLGSAYLPPADRDGLFIAGIFSLLDTLLNVPMAQALASLSLSENLTLALLDDDGIYAPYLRLAIACEISDQTRINELAATAGLSVDTVNLAHIKTLIWVEGFSL